ncbi:unnamed protein product, partial [Phaeothamnion confervicola]
DSLQSVAELLPKSRSIFAALGAAGRHGREEGAQPGVDPLVVSIRFLEVVMRKALEPGQHFVELGEKLDARRRDGFLDLLAVHGAKFGEIRGNLGGRDEHL